MYINEKNTEKVVKGQREMERHTHPIHKSSNKAHYAIN